LTKILLTVMNLKSNFQFNDGGNCSSMDWTRLADDVTIEETAKSLREKGIDVIVVNNREEARQKVLKLFPQGLR